MYDSDQVIRVFFFLFFLFVFFFIIYLTIINSTLPHSVNISIYKYIIAREEFRMEEKKIEQIEGEKWRQKIWILIFVQKHKATLT